MRQKITLNTQNTMSKKVTQKIENEYYEGDVKITRIAMKKTKNTNVMKSKLHAKKNRPNNSYLIGPSTKCVSSVYSGVGFLTEKEMHRALSPLAAQCNQAREQH